MQWLNNKPWYALLPQGCECGFEGRHLRIGGSFTPDFLRAFESRCRGGSKSVYGESPRPGSAVAAYSGSYPLPIMRLMARGLYDHVHSETVADTAPRRAAPYWIRELVGCLEFEKVYAWPFRNAAHHINVKESMVAKSLMKFCCIRHPGHRV
eukprot:15450645-Alexandrium_andersonii.AAC.1